MFYEYAYMIAEAAFGLIAGIPTFAVSIAVYVLSALALYAIARRRELKNPWLSWVPVGNVWILGSISDQYSYVAKGEVKSKRKILLALNIIQIVLILAVMVMAVSMGVQAIGAGITGRMDEAIARGLLGSLAGIRQAEAEALSQVEEQRSALRRQYQQQIAEAVAANEADRAEALFNEAKRVDESLVATAVNQANENYKAWKARYG